MDTKRKITSHHLLKVTIVLLILGVALYTGFGMAIAQPKEVKIGVIYPLSGPVAHAGKMSKDAVSLCVDYVNNKYPELPIPIGKWEGIPGLNGAKIRLIFADHRGEPDRGADLAKKFILDEKVAGICGCYHSSVTKTVSTVCERSKIPMINPESTSPVLTKRGYKWFFRDRNFCAKNTHSYFWSGKFNRYWFCKLCRFKNNQQLYIQFWFRC